MKDLHRLLISAKVAAITIAMMVFSSPVFAQEDYPAIQLRTNGLYDLAASPNLGIEIQTDLGIAWQLDYIGAWWNSDARHRFFSNYAFQTELRYYIDHNNDGFPYTGHHAGVYGQLATYDFEFGGTGYLCRNLDDSFGIGVSYGYTKALTDRLSVDFTVGLGYFSSKYDRYKPNTDDTGYTRSDSRKLTFFGPTKLEVSLVWNINYENRKSYK